MTAVCQRCGERRADWTVRPAEFHVGDVQHWHVVLCEPCTRAVERVVIQALAAVRPLANPA